MKNPVRQLFAQVKETGGCAATGEMVRHESAAETEREVIDVTRDGMQHVTDDLVGTTVESARTASRIVMTCDFMRTGEHIEFNQSINLKRMLDLLLPAIEAATDLPVQTFPDPDGVDYRSLVSKLYATFGLEPSADAWAKTYHASSLTEFADLTDQVSALLKEAFSGAVVISFESSPMLRHIIERHAVAHIDVRMHFERFMDDLPLTFSSNSKPVRDAIRRFQIERNDVAQQCRSIKSSTAARQLPENTVVFMAQTRRDSSVITQDGNFFDIRPHMDKVSTILESYGTKNFLIKAHPIEPDSPVVKALLTLPGARLTNINAYELMCSDNVSAFVTFSSSTGHEAEAFGKPVHWISTGQPIRRYIPVMFEFRNAEFWRDVLLALNVQVKKAHVEQRVEFQPEFVRQWFGMKRDGSLTQGPTQTLIGGKLDSLKMRLSKWRGVRGTVS
ncbi:hypothetical protein PQQ51_11885 [Paraburkholderia xenovorans]|uniref:hypothetical protein n=1 Tax=Paraburkholderia xenovorans TaxID=36873 RepID=UPI0038BD6A4B